VGRVHHQSQRVIADKPAATRRNKLRAAPQARRECRLFRATPWQVVRPTGTSYLPHVVIAETVDRPCLSRACPPRGRELPGKPGVPAEYSEAICLLAKEVLDALPVARFRWRRTQPEQLSVVLHNERLVSANRRAGYQLADFTT
jgi:hypothetical protein